MFYAYILAYPGGVPFYVGKGKGKRYLARGCRDSFAKRVAEKIVRSGGEVDVTIIAAQDEASVFSMERALIAFYGRRDMSTGILCNRSSGGEGLADPGPGVRARWSAIRKGVVLSVATKAKLSAVRKGMPNGWLGKKRAAATIEKLRAALLGNKRLLGYQHSIASRCKMSESQRKRWNDPEARAKMATFRAAAARGRAARWGHRDGTQ